MDYKRFFNRKSREVAQDLLGRFLLRDTRNGVISGRIIETGAYESGETPSREGMLDSPGSLFLMSYRGSHLLNIVSDKEGYPSCVEIRKLHFNDEIIDGSGAVTKFLKVTPDLDGILIGDELQIIGKKPRNLKISKKKGNSDNCLGYFYLIE